MASTYSTLKIQLMATGENSGTWGNVTNVNLGTALEEAIVGSADVTFASANQTLTLTDTNATQTARNLRLNLTGTTGGVARTLTVPAIEKIYIVNNGCADTVTIQNATGTGIAVPAGKTLFVYNTGTNVVDAVTHLTSLTLASALPVASGGTGSTTATFSGANITSLNANNISSGTLAVGQGGTSSTTLTAENVIIGNGTSAVKFVAPGTTGNVLTSNGTAWLSQASTGGVTTFSAGTTGFTPSTATSGAVTLAGTLATANGGTNLTGFTAANNAIYSTSSSALTAGTLPITAGGTGATNAATARSNLGAGTGNGSVTSVGGTGTVNGISLSGTVTSSGNLTLGGTLSGVSLTTQVSGTLPIANGGTGATSAATALSNLGGISGSSTQVCQAWVNFNGTGTVAIRAQFNVSSITDNGTGDFSINFTNSLSDANYSAFGSTSGLSIDTFPVVVEMIRHAGSETLPATNSFRMFVLVSGNNTPRDTPYVYASFFR